MLALDQETSRNKFEEKWITFSNFFLSFSSFYYPIHFNPQESVRGEAKRSSFDDGALQSCRFFIQFFFFCMACRLRFSSTFLYFVFHFSSLPFLRRLLHSFARALH